MSWIRPLVVDEVEEDELAHVPARHHAAGEPAADVQRTARLHPVTFRPDRGDLVAVGKALGRRHGP